MIPDAFRSSRPAARVRAMLLAEVLAFVAVMVGVIWLHPGKGRPLQWFNIVLWSLAAILPVGANLLHGDRLRDSGLRVDNLGPSAREACLATGVLAAAVAAGALAGRGWHVEPWPDVAARAGEVLAVAFIQQYLLQAFMLRRLLQAGLGRAWAVAVASGLFAAIHAPNVVLMALTAAAAVVWCCLFLRQANLFVLAPSHGLLSLWVYYAWPKTWHLRLVVGPRALEHLSRYWGW